MSNTAKQQALTTQRAIHERAIEEIDAQLAEIAKAAKTEKPQPKPKKVD